ncbi:hypothetical protein F4777DRAFT_601046 [Nemania sp. FL0916]|nr:hypothetical protein F4777DRAFT_601046 [Nemania sp. FL0916]
MAGRTILLFKRDGNWTATPTPDPSPAPTAHPANAGPHGPPYGSTIAVVGGVPTVSTDVPIAAVLLALFAATAAAHMAVLQANKRAGRRFVFSGMLFALGVLRSVALAMRMAWAAHARSADVAIAAGILTQTGSVLVFVLNLLLAQRVLRAYHPRLGWHRGATAVLALLVAGVVASLLLVIAVTVHSFFTLDPAARRTDRDVQLVAGTYMATLAFVPLPVVALAALLPRRGCVEKFGAGRWRSKIRLLLFTSAVAALGAGFRVATGFAPRPLNNPAWYHSRACYYCFNYITDLVISAAYLFSRFDRRFIVPNGAKGPGDYGKGLRVRPSSALSLTSRGERDEERGEEEGNETDSEKLAKLRTESNEDGSEKSALAGCDEKGKGKEKDVGATVEDDEKQSTPALKVDAQTQTYGDWNGVPWPFRPSWNTPRTFGPAPETSPADPSIEGTGDASGELADHPIRPMDGIDEASSLSGTDSNSSTYIQEPEAAHLRPQQAQSQSPQPDDPPLPGQALTVDEEIHLGANLWPFTSETQASGRDPVSRSNSSTTHTQASCSRKTSRRHISRSRSRKDAERQSIEGGWI